VPETLRVALKQVQDVPKFDKYEDQWNKISGGVRTD